MNIELRLLSTIVPFFIPPAQTAFQIESQWAVAIAVGLFLVGALVGLLIGWLITGRDLQHTRAEAEQLRLARDNAQSARSQALNERERAMRELQGKQQEFALLESQFRSTQKQLDQAQAALRVSEQQSEELAASTRVLRTQVDELRKHLADSEQASSERKMSLSQLTSELNEVQARYNEAQRLAAERQAMLASVNAQLSEYRARIAESDISTAEMQATLLSLGSQLEAHRMRLAEIERRAQTPKEALAPSVAKSALVNTSVAESQNDRPSAPPISAPFQPPSTPAPTESKMAIITASTGRVDALQSEIDQLTRQLHALRAMTPGRAPSGEDSKSLTLKRPEPSTPPAGKLSETRLPVTSRETNLESVSPAPAIAARSYDAPAAAPPPPSSNGNGKASPPETEETMSLEMIKGIGTGYAARLQAAGITTIRDLANATPGQLEAIIKAPKWRQPDYTTWIRSARMIVRGVK